MHCLYVCLLVCMYMYVCIYKHTNNACSLRIQYSLNVYVHHVHVCVCVCLRVSGERRILTAQQSCACWRLLPYATSRGNHIIGYLTHIHARTTPRTNLTEFQGRMQAHSLREHAKTHTCARMKNHALTSSPTLT